MAIDISEAIQSLNTKGGNTHEYVITGTPTSEAEYKSLVQFVESEDANGTAVFSSTQPYTWSQVNTEKSALQTTYDGLAYARARAEAYPSQKDFMEAYTEKEIGGDSTKWDAYKTAYNKVRTDNPKG